MMTSFDWNPQVDRQTQRDSKLLPKKRTQDIPGAKTLAMNKSNWNGFLKLLPETMEKYICIFVQELTQLNIFFSLKKTNLF